VHLLDISYLVHTYGYAGIFITIFLESGLIFFLPGDSLLFTVGIFAAAGTLSFFTIIPGTFLATFLGGIGGYIIGVNLEILRERSIFRKLVPDKHIARTHKFFEEYGRSAVIFSRFVPIVRTFLPIVAGMAKMKRKPFVLFSLLGSILWPLVVVSAGFFLGQKFPGIEHYMGWVIAGVVLLSFLPAVFHFLRKKT
jgi:membrane-associated protein